MKSNPNTTAPVRPLNMAGLALWRRVQAEYGIGDAGGLEMLQLACESTDRAASLRSAIEADGGPVLRGPLPDSQLREHPAVKAELSAMSFTARTLARLGLHLEPVKAHGRPPVPTSIGWQRT